MLKQEQEEYAREGIQWTPVKYFNNRVICELVDAPHQGIIAIMDEACLNPTKVSMVQDICGLSLFVSLSIESSLSAHIRLDLGVPRCSPSRSIIDRYLFYESLDSTDNRVVEDTTLSSLSWFRSTNRASICVVHILSLGGCLCASALNVC